MKKLKYTRAELIKILGIDDKTFLSEIICGNIQPQKYYSEEEVKKICEHYNITFELSPKPKKKRKFTLSDWHKRAKKRNKERAMRFKKMYETMTLEEISQKEKITRERVRQVLKTIGIDGKDGATQKNWKESRKQKLEEQQEKKEAYCQRIFQCSLAEFKQVTGNTVLRGNSSKLIKLYRYHRNMASRLHKEWRIALPFYAKIMQEHLNNYGIGRGKMVLARHNKIKDFTVDNVHVVPFEINSFLTGGFIEAQRRMNNKDFMVNTGRRAAIILYENKFNIETIAKLLHLSTATISTYLNIERSKIVNVDAGQSSIHQH